MQLFTKPASRWLERECDADEAEAFRDARTASTVVTANAHDSYLINLASPDPTLHARSLAAFIAELRRSESLGLEAVVSHPGNFMDDRASGIARNADAITAALQSTPGRVRLLLETTAGTGTSLGATFEELAAIIAAVAADVRDRVGVCVDSCHIFAAGYDLVGAYDDVWQRFDDVIGRPRLGLLHLNDSRYPLGARRDRHALIAEGTLGELPFRRLMTDERLRATPKVIETPVLDDPAVTNARMLDRLRGYARSA